MAHIYGSFNSRFFAVLREDMLALFRGAGAIWTRQVRGVGPLLRVGNQGDVFFRTGRGVARLPYHRDAALEELEALDVAVRGEEGGRFGDVAVNCEGTQICVERIFPEKGLSTKLKRILRRGEPAEAPPSEVHQLLVFSRNSGTFRSFCRTVLPPEQKGTFRWAASPSLDYLVVSTPDKKGATLFKVIDTHAESYTEFTTKVPEILGLRVSDVGTVLLEVRAAPDRSHLVVFNSSGEKFLMNPPPGWQVAHLGVRTVGLRDPERPLLAIRRFDDTVLCQADLGALDRLGFDYEILFNARDELDVVTLKGSELQVTRADSDTLPVDAKRWSLMADQLEWEAHHHVQRKQAQEREAESRRRRSEERSREMADSFQLEGPAPFERVWGAEEEPPTQAPGRVPAPARIEAPPRIPAPVEAPGRIPARIDVPGIIPIPEPPQAPGRIPAPARIEAPPRIPAPVEAPGRIPAPARIEAPARIPAPAEAPGRVPAPARLEMPGRVAPPVEAGPAAPAGAPVPEVPVRSRADVEAELERLRMRFISGSLERPEYLEQKEALDRELAGFREAGPKPPAPAGLEHPRLELEVRAPAAPTPSPPAPPVLSHPGLPAFPDPAESSRRLPAREFERQKVERLLESLEERRAREEVSEETYQELRERYLRRLAES